MLNQCNLYQISEVITKLYTLHEVLIHLFVATTMIMCSVLFLFYLYKMEQNLISAIYQLSAITCK